MQKIQILIKKVTLISIFGIIAYLIFGYYPLLRFRLKNNDLTFETINTDNIADYIDISSVSIDAQIGNMLVIPRIGVKAKIWEGASLAILDTNEGVWHEPLTSNPQRGSNMVIAGHRRQFIPPNTATFYLLPELNIGDIIMVFWNKKQYSYKIIKSFETDSFDQFTYQKTISNSITLYTCFPLGTAARRWVIRAEEFYN